jgi:predicted enzyme related to lactoylglutathione lyase
MRYTTLSIVLFVLLTSCSTTHKPVQSMETPTNNATQDTTPKVTGIGGVFFYSEDPKATKEWYATNLGIEVNAWGAVFESRDKQNPEEIQSTAWNPFKQGDAYFSPSKKEFMINYRVQHIEALVKKLKANGVTVLDEIATYEYGKFVHIMDADGTKIELWEPTVDAHKHL